MKTRPTWTPRRIMALIVIGPVAAIAMGVAIQLANPGYMQDARDGGTPVVQPVPTISMTIVPYSGVNR